MDPEIVTDANFFKLHDFIERLLRTNTARTEPLDTDTARAEFRTAFTSMTDAVKAERQGAKMALDAATAQHTTGSDPLELEKLLADRNHDLEASKEDLQKMTTDIERCQEALAESRGLCDISEERVQALKAEIADYQAAETLLQKTVAKYQADGQSRQSCAAEKAPTDAAHNSVEKELTQAKHDLEASQARVKMLEAEVKQFELAALQGTKRLRESRSEVGCDEADADGTPSLSKTTT